MRLTCLILTVVSFLASAALADGIAAPDTVYILGGPDRWDGRFETPEGEASWQGWTWTEGFAPHWQISGYEVPPGGGDFAYWCGTTFPDGCGEGYGNNWEEMLFFTGFVSDPNSDTPVRLACLFSCDLEPGHDSLVFQMKSLGEWETIAGPYDGRLVGESLDVQIVFHPDDYEGPFFAISLRILVTTDGEGSDEDCLYDSVGACQIDNLRVSFPLSGYSRYEDFEDQSTEYWYPPLPWDYAAPMLGLDLPESDSDQDNRTWQVNWLRYVDPPGDPDLLFTGEVSSPVLAVPADVEEMSVAFDTYVNSSQVVFCPRVRSTAALDPDELEASEWMCESFLASSPGFHRVEQPVGALLVPGARWMQVRLSAHELFDLYDIQGEDTPYFDNVAVKAVTTGGTTNVPEPDQLRLHAYPNPFNPCTSIAFELPEAGLAAVTLFDLRGREVRRLLEGHLPAGPRVIEWDGRDDAGRDVSAGTYLCRLNAIGRERMIRLTMVR